MILKAVNRLITSNCLFAI